ncbi:MAG: winged helix-turn-helix transcriptional regulator [Dongiaceae bacterium]
MVTTGTVGTILGPDCPTRRTLELVADKWTPLIICVLSDGTARYSELQRRCVGISRKMLSQTLRRMERDGLVLRAVFPEVPPRTEYSLTDLGESLIEPLTGLCAWGARHLPRIDAARQAAAARREEKVLEAVS